MNKIVVIIFIAFCGIGISFAQSGKVKIYSESSPSPENSKQEIKKDVPNIKKQNKIDDDEIRVDTDLVVVSAKISDRKGKIVLGLEKEEFKIFENNIEQEIVYFSNEDEPFTVVLLLDMSYSSVFKLDEIRNAALTFTEQLRAKDKVMVASFDEKVHILCEPTNDKKILRLAVEGTEIRSGTSLYKALDTVLVEKLKAISGRKAIVLLSDGVDTTSRNISAQNLLKKFNEVDVLVFPIQYDTFGDVQKTNKDNTQVYYDDDDRPVIIAKKEIGEREADYNKADKFLKDISYGTGGRVFRVSSKSNLQSAFSSIADELRKIYSFGYYPDGEKNIGEKYDVRVRVYRPNLVIRARDSFIWGKK
ncbi:MAG: VWA domain-containing protein [Aridibacter sp.]